MVSIDLLLFLDLHNHIKKERLINTQLVELLKNPNILLDLKKKVGLYNDHIWELHSKKVQMEKELEEKKKRLLFLSVAYNVKCQVVVGFEINASPSIIPQQYCIDVVI